MERLDKHFKRRGQFRFEDPSIPLYARQRLGFASGDQQNGWRVLR